MNAFVFDGTFEGLLTSIFETYEFKVKDVRLFDNLRYQPGLIDETHEVISDKAKSDRVWKAFVKKIGKQKAQNAYTVFLSEDAEAFQHIFDFIRYVFDSGEGAESNFGNPSVIAIHKWERSVSRERHRMKAFIRFEQMADGIYYAPIEPDFNVLPLIAGFFKNRYADQQWIIYDTKRKYGLFYDLENVTEIAFDFAENIESGTTPYLSKNLLDDKQELYGLLWNDYFRNTNIPARKNMKLHLRHVPKRYWKYLTEKKHN
ncbi:TIGR03915 family putative DNA repair protein [Flavobacterium silvaticum]|uniref:DNA metabolism protein n=1 Tax=Flavobacterium silvaticum TaxID=1852020 RepID=A0A972JI25_9FLAO|nr:TIGR03915 family putative DNA repair protein [Flavobacterium silvaticum]NMH27748.1 DNA metabolism protein [Flavobacterium silvaticum]